MNLLEQLQNIWVSPSEMWMDETLLIEKEEPVEEMDSYQMIDKHIVDMQPMIQSMDSGELLYLVWQIISVYNSNINGTNE